MAGGLTLTWMRRITALAFLVVAPATASSASAARIALAQAGSFHVSAGIGCRLRPGLGPDWPSLACAYRNARTGLPVAQSRVAVISDRAVLIEPAATERALGADSDLVREAQPAIAFDPALDHAKGVGSVVLRRGDTVEVTGTHLVCRAGAAVLTCVETNGATVVPGSFAVAISTRSITVARAMENRLMRLGYWPLFGGR